MIKEGKFPVGDRDSALTTPTSTPSDRTARTSAYIDYGAVILDISDKAHPKVVSRWASNPPYPGWAHTALPLFSRDLMIVSHESTKDNARGLAQAVWVLDMRMESKPMPISTLPMPPLETFSKRGGRYGGHNLHENQPSPLAWRSDTIIFSTLFNGGLRAYDISDPFRPEEIGYFVPGAPPMSRANAIQINDVFVDDRASSIRSIVSRAACIRWR